MSAVSSPDIKGLALPGCTRSEPDQQPWESTIVSIRMTIGG